MSEVLNTLTAARAIIEGGWHQGDLTDGEGNYCLKAAIGLACGGYVLNNGWVTNSSIDYSHATPEEMLAQSQAIRTEVATLDAICKVLPPTFKCISLFNDDQQTTKEDVLAVLDDAIHAQSGRKFAVMSA